MQDNVLIPPSDIKKIVKSLVQKLSKMFLNDVKNLSEISQELATTYESSSAS